MGKIREHTNQTREKCVELHKSGNGYKKLLLASKCPYLPAILKKFKATDPKRTPKPIQKSLTEHKIKRLPWPSQFPDLNL